jgi:glutathione-regulated potassium-efflux system protein KefB
VVLSESSYRHELEADIEPFRGILLGLFFLSVGMSLNLPVIAESWPWVLAIVAAFVLAKAAGTYGVARVFRARHRDALRRAFYLAQGGEFAFVLYAAALTAGIITGEENAILTAIVIISMAITPLAIMGLNAVQSRSRTVAVGEKAPEGLTGSVLVIGFGRVGQIASQLLLCDGHDISIIDTDVEMIKAAREFEFEVYYGDGTRLDILHAAGAEHARAILVCVDKGEDAIKIVELVKAEFPLVPVIARACDRRNSLELVKVGADVQIRETFESALLIGARALEAMGADPTRAAEIAADVRQRDEKRFELELVGGYYAGRALFSGKPTPATEAGRPGDEG